MTNEPDIDTEYDPGAKYASMTDEEWYGVSTEEVLEIQKWLEIRKQEGQRIDPDNAEVMWCYAQTLDPYDIVANFPEEFYQVGRAYFARAPGSDIWVWFGDIPNSTRDRLRKKHSSQLAFPAGLTFPDELFG